MGVLNTLYGNRAGQILLDMIGRAQRHKVVIVPYRGEDGHANAEAVPWDWAAATPLGEFQRADERDRHGHITHHGVIYNPALPTLGTGVGSDVIVRYSRGLFQAPNAFAGFLPDEVLFHELSHGFRELRGHLLQTRVDGEYTNQEEFWAVLLTNIYLSSKHSGRMLRDSYNHWIAADDSAPVVGGSIPARRWMADYRELIMRLYGEERDLCDQLASVDANFNPFWLVTHPASGLFSNTWGGR